MAGQATVKEREVELFAAIQAAIVEDATCFIVQVGFGSTGVLFYIGPFNSPQEAMSYDVRVCDDHAAMFPNEERLTTSVHVVRRPILKEDQP